MRTTLNGRPVEVTEFHFERDVDDSYISGAYYSDTYEDLTEEELIQLNDESTDLLYAEHAEHWVCVAEDWADAQEDR